MKGSFFKIAAIILAATIGEGVFALPYVFYKSGWALGLLYLAVLAAIVIFAHLIYLRTLESEGEKERLLGLVKKYLGNAGFWFGIVVIVIGLLLAVVAYLIIGPKFIELAFPWISPSAAFVIFWFLIAVPVLVTNSRAVELEVVGIVFVAGILLFVFATALPHATLMLVPALSPGNLFLPFGIILLTLTGWTGIEPAYESGKKMKKSWLAAGVVAGTLLAGILYVLFVAGIFGSAGKITADTISGIQNWAEWKRLVVAALGLFAIGTGAVPLTHEIRNAFEKDMHWHPRAAQAIIIFLPPIAVLSGFNQFAVVLGLAGGCFIALQYLLILLVGRRALVLSAIQKFLLDAVALVFILAAVYEVYGFVVH
jgi:amino acid permease